MATGAWDRTAAVLEFIALHGGVKKADRDKLNPFRNLKKRSSWAGFFATGRALLAEKRRRQAAAAAREPAVNGSCAADGAEGG